MQSYITFVVASLLLGSASACWNGPADGCSGLQEYTNAVVCTEYSTTPPKIGPVPPPARDCMVWGSQMVNGAQQFTFCCK
ncbi:hypothetical protein LZ30DRAFT_339558 [Colletotrichum cereale]|nr:hypothetical protein LZ30DRAFT_339558 [Colletotrichum cereale]